MEKPLLFPRANTSVSFARARKNSCDIYQANLDEESQVRKLRVRKERRRDSQTSCSYCCEPRNAYQSLRVARLLAQIVIVDHQSALREASSRFGCSQPSRIKRPSLIVIQAPSRPFQSKQPQDATHQGRSQNGRKTLQTSADAR